MTIVISKTLLRGFDLKNLRLLDTKCKGKEGQTHLSVTTSLTGCKTASRYTPTAIIYSNTLIIPVATKSAVTRLHDIKVQFSCYYSSMVQFHRLVGRQLKQHLNSVKRPKGTWHCRWECFITRHLWILTRKMISLLLWGCTDDCSLRYPWQQMTKSCQSELIDVMPRPPRIKRILWNMNL